MNILAWITCRVDLGADFLTHFPYTPIASRIVDRAIVRREQQQQRDGGVRR